MGVRLAHPAATLPTRATAGAAGYDLHACEPVILWPGQSVAVRTGVCVALPPGVEAQVRGRSGLAFRSGILAHVGTIDSDYRGEIGVLLFNTGTWPHEVRVGDRVAQLVFAHVLQPEFNEVQELPPTARAAGGFGSTGA